MKSLHNLIGTTTRTAIQQDRLIKQVISRIVPATTLAHIEFCRLESGKVRITVDNAVWISKLRFSERQILGALRGKKLDAFAMSFHVAPAEVPVSRTTLRKANPASDEAARALITLAATINDGDKDFESIQEKLPTTHSVVRQPNDRLRQELLKLAETLKKPS